MWFSNLILLAMSVTVLSDMLPTSSSSMATPACTLTYTDTQPPQIGPTSTVYDAIMTTYLYAVDCNICTVTNTALALSSGPFSVRSTSSLLAITQVQCIPTGSASTRLHGVTHGKMAAAATHNVAWDGPRNFKSSDIFRRSDQATDAALADLVTKFADSLSLDIPVISDDLQDEFSDIVSAMFALSVCDSGMDLHAACTSLGNAQTKYNLAQSWYNPDNVESIVCFCADFGYDFNTTRQQLYASLYAALLGIFSASDLTNDRGQICDNLGLFNRTGPSLGIDIQQYQDLVCENIPSATPTGPWYGLPPVTPYVTNNMTTWVTPTPWGPNMTISATGIAPAGTASMTVSETGSPASGSSNMTIAGTGNPAPETSNMTISGTGTFSSQASNMTISGTGFPLLNATGNSNGSVSPAIQTQANLTALQPTGMSLATDTAQFNSLPPNVTAVPGVIDPASEQASSVAHTPLAPNAMQFFPAVSTEAPRPGLFKRY